jgi:hypothetical protein
MFLFEDRTSSACEAFGPDVQQTPFDTHGLGVPAGVLPYYIVIEVKGF